MQERLQICSLLWLAVGAGSFSQPVDSPRNTEKPAVLQGFALGSPPRLGAFPRFGADIPNWRTLAHSPLAMPLRRH
jgi:hypothetical protein